MARARKKASPAKDNAATVGYEAELWRMAQSVEFIDDCFPDLKADFILANPPFNVSDWGGERLREDKRWKYGASPKGDANSAPTTAP